MSFCCEFIDVGGFCVFVFLQELTKVQAQLEEQGRKLQEKQEQCSQLETSLKDGRDKLLTAEQRIETLETQAKVSGTAAYFCFVTVTSFWRYYRLVVWLLHITTILIRKWSWIISLLIVIDCLLINLCKICILLCIQISVIWCVFCMCFCLI